MKLNWDKIYWNMSVSDITDFIKNNKKKLSEFQTLLLHTRIEEMRKENAEFADKLIANLNFKLAKMKNKQTIKNVFKDMKRIRDYFIKSERKRSKK